MLNATKFKAMRYNLKNPKLSGYIPAHMHINSVAHLTYSTEDTFNVAFNNEPKLPLLQD